MLYSYYLLAIVYIILKGAEVNLYTLKYKPVYRGIQICFHTLYIIFILFHRTLLVHLNQGRNSQLQLGQELNKLNQIIGNIDWLVLFGQFSLVYWLIVTFPITAVLTQNFLLGRWLLTWPITGTNFSINHVSCRLAMFVSSSMIPARCVENINFHRYVKSLNPDVRPKNFI